MVLDGRARGPYYSPHGQNTRQYRQRNNRKVRRRLLALISGLAVVAIILTVGVVAERRSHSVSHSPVAKAPTTWKLKFNANFMGTTLNTKVWGTCYPWEQKTAGCTNFGNNGEAEWYLASQDKLNDGTLELVAQHEPTDGLTRKGTSTQYACRSGMVTTYPSFKFEYGFVQVTAKIPFGYGLWPAIWLAAANEKWPPEIDMLEHWNSESRGKVYLHPTGGARQGGPVTMPNLSTGWHTFTLKWTSTRLTWYYDGTQVFTTTNGVPMQSMYLIMNLADTTADPSICSGTMLIKSVKIWQP